MNQPDETSRISSLIRLIDDRDEFVRSRVRDKLIEIGEDALPFLHLAANEEKPLKSAQVREIIQAIFPKQIGEQFRKLASGGHGADLDLERGVLLLTEFGHPDSRSEEISQTLDRWAEELSPKLSPKQSPREAIETLTRFLFQEKGITGNRERYMDPDNSYFNKVIQRRTGIPISLSVLCILVARRLNLPIVGVGLPGHYIVKYDSLDPIYFDPFHKGRVLTRVECMDLVNDFGYQFEEHHLSASTNRETLVRMINNLIMVYHRNGVLEKTAPLRDYVKILMDPHSDLSQQTV
ncbi:MAG: hypothetical protein COV67_02595 [Nitrospinae bacterium CG11_big_fil_rev_8_21_14_0_20_56_8]|nr:MAG: hypothetical protein COV67_02595 [Nitrospinae bacterium CG11_big_fil_rev_8_21_14_0_20_56_8]